MVLDLGKKVARVAVVRVERAAVDVCPLAELPHADLGQVPRRQQRDECLLEALLADRDAPTVPCHVLTSTAKSDIFEIPFVDQTFENLDKALRSELHATWMMMQPCFPLMKEHSGSIINFGSRAAQGLPGFASYSSAKAAVIALSHAVAQECGEFGIRVNTMIPVAMTDSITEQTNDSYKRVVKVMADSIIAASPLHRLSNPEDDIVPVLLFLASDDSRWITGQDLRTEGGMDIHW